MDSEEQDQSINLCSLIRAFTCRTIGCIVRYTESIEPHMAV